MGLQEPLVYSPPKVDRICGIWGVYYNIPKAIFNLLKGDYTPHRGAAVPWLRSGLWVHACTRQPRRQ